MSEGVARSADQRKMVVAAFRLVLGVLVLVALSYQFNRSTELSPTFTAANFFSYFTNLSNIVGACVFIYVALTWRHRRSQTVELWRGAAVVYLAVTGVVYNLLLSNIDLGALAPWVNTVIHAVMPLAVVIDWLLDPPLLRLERKQVAWWLVFPLAYVAYSLTRGPIVNWYPYPFLDPDQPGGTWALVAYVIGISLFFVGVIALVRVVGNRRKEERTAVEHASHSEISA